MLIPSRLSSTVGGAGLVGLAVKNAIPAEGQPFVLPKANKGAVLNFWLPLGGGLALFIAGLRKRLPRGYRLFFQVVGGGVAVYVGGREIASGRLFGSLEDAIRGPILASAGVAVAASLRLPSARKKKKS